LPSLIIQCVAELSIIILDRTRHVMTVAEQIHFNQPKRADRNLDMLIMLSYVAFAIVGLVLIYAASSGSGTSAGELASMVAFP
jgi:hypothetical protein